jgi:2,4-dienoyl-CoA reductase-like NADH-dependent reductase (Old Yellow Enzyme family)
VDDSVALVSELKRLGVDVVDVSSGGLGGLSSNAAPHTRTPGYHVPIAARIREATGVLTQVVGLITDAAQADAIIRDGSADLIAIAREALRNPFWAAHASQALGATEFAAWPQQYAWWLRARAEHVGNS